MDDVIQNFYYGTIAIPLIIGIAKISNLKVRHYHWIVFLLLLTLSTEFYATYLGKNKTPNAWVINIYIVLEFFILTYVFYKTFRKKCTKKIIILLVPIAVVFAVYNQLYVQKQHFHSYTFIFFSFLILFYILEFIREQLMIEYMIVEKNALLWFSVGGLIFYTGNILVTGFLPEWINISINLAQKIYIWNKWFNITFYIFVGVGFYLNENS